MTEGNTTTEW